MKNPTLVPKEAHQQINENIGSQLRQLRKHCNSSLAEAGELIGVSGQQLSRFERGKNRISASQLYLIASHTDTPIYWFFAGLDQKNLSKYLSTQSSWSRVGELKTFAEHHLHSDANEPLYETIKSIGSIKMKMFLAALMKEIIVMTKI